MVGPTSHFASQSATKDKSYSYRKSIACPEKRLVIKVRSRAGTT